MAQPSTIYKPGKLNYVWNYIGTTLKEFKAKLLGYRAYTATITQTGTSDPVVVVLENNLGQDIVWTYDAVGVYIGTAVGLFPVANDSKIVVLTSQTANSAAGITLGFRNNNDEVYLQTYDLTGAAANGILSQSLVEVRIYL